MQFPTVSAQATASVLTLAATEGVRVDDLWGLLGVDVPGEVPEGMRVATEEHLTLLLRCMDRAGMTRSRFVLCTRRPMEARTCWAS